MNIRHCIAIFSLFGSTAFISGCGPADAIPVSAMWTVNGQKYTSFNTTVTGTLFESDCDDNNKLWVYLGSIPTSSTTMKAVAYNVTAQGPQLNSNEVCIDIAHGAGSDYLTTGTGSTDVSVDVTDGKVTIDFENISFRHVDGNANVLDTAMITGYIHQL